MASSLATAIAEQAWDCHGDEFSRILELEGPSELAELIEEILAASTDDRPLLGGRQVYWHAPTGIVVIANPSVAYGGTAVIADFDYYLSVR